MMDILGDTVVCWDYTPLSYRLANHGNQYLRMMIFEMIFHHDLQYGISWVVPPPSNCGK